MSSLASSSSAASASSAHRSKRVLISAHSFPCYPAPLSRRSSKDARLSQTTNEISHESPGLSSAPVLSKDIQTSLLQIGMKVRKNVSDGYKVPQKTQSESAIHNKVLVDPYVNENEILFEDARQINQRLQQRHRKRSYDIEDEANSDTETVMDEDGQIEANRLQIQTDFDEADFLVPREIVDSDFVMNS